MRIAYSTTGLSRQTGETTCPSFVDEVIAANDAVAITKMRVYDSPGAPAFRYKFSAEVLASYDASDAAAAAIAARVRELTTPAMPDVLVSRFCEGQPSGRMVLSVTTNAGTPEGRARVRRIAERILEEFSPAEIEAGMAYLAVWPASRMIA